ncbi:hypothetical protein [uncultured Sphingomonas sp.]|uniref:hypothetical protein n=1 Tax=uncultured Sphingomonas sp. TaxID=158754 RepID=UPI0035CA0987
MIVQTLVEAAAGLLLTGATLADIFATILVPGQVEGQLRVGMRVRRATMPLARWSARGVRAPGSRPSNTFAPGVFVISFGAWMLLLLAGYGLLFHAARALFSPALSAPDAIYIAGSSLLTLGVSEVDAHGAARWLILAAGLSGFAVISATISYILQIHQALHQREVRVLTLGSLAGNPPSGLRLLEEVAHLQVTDELPEFFRSWRDWAAGVLHSHTSSPVLIYFHSVDSESDWLASLEAMLDAATLLMALTEHPARGTAALLHRTGSRTAARLCQLLKLDEVQVDPLDQPAVEVLVARLEAAGFPVVAADATAVTTLGRLRADYLGRMHAIADALGAGRTRPLA